MAATSLPTPADVQALFPGDVAVGLRHADDGRPAALLSEEESLVGPLAVTSRREDVARGRAAARDALAVLGHAAAAIGRGPSREPLWPPGIVGSITHSGGVAIAVVAPADRYRGVGIDFEARGARLSPEAARIVASTNERAWINAAPNADAATTRRILLFAAKEAIFKALFPIERVWLDFGHVELVSRDPLDFDACLRKPAAGDLPAGTVVTVRCAVLAECVLAACSVPAGRY
jgi:4'-phosphopantetheinyl transferase EntD